MLGFFGRHKQHLASLIKGIRNYKLLNALRRKSLRPSWRNTLTASQGDADVLKDSIAILQRIDQKEFLDVFNTFQDASPAPGYSKYLDAASHVARGVRYARLLDLHHPPSQSILDIGSGAGYFPFICRFYGHHAMALDADHVAMYRRLKEALNVTCVCHTIMPFHPLPDFDVRFDVITGFQILFDRYANGLLWSAAEWQYMIDDLKTHLTPRGKIFLGLNTFTEAHAPIVKKNLDFFRSLGARTEGTNVLLTDLFKS